MMSTTKSIYKASFNEILKEAMRAELGRELDLDKHTLTYSMVGGDVIVVSIVDNANQVASRFVVKKVSLHALIERQIYAPYQTPISYNTFKNLLNTSYGIVLEDNDLERDDELLYLEYVSPGTSQFKVSTLSRRWIGGEMITIHHP